MVANQREQFDRTYQRALATHLARKPQGTTTSRAARAVGRDAIALGLNATDLALTHDRAFRRLAAVNEASEAPAPDAANASPAAAFYIETLAPLEKMRQMEQAKSQLALNRLERQLQQEITRQNKLLAGAQRQKEQVRQMTYQFLLAQENERREISLDLHDEIAQFLAGINVRLAALKKVAEIGQLGIDERIDQTQKLVEQSVAAVHRYALRLRPSLLDDLGLVPSLRSYIKNFPGLNDLSIHFKADSEADFLSNEQRTALYRVSQEALTNVVRHAHARSVHLSLRQRSGRIQLEVRDDGKSFNAERILNSTSYTHLGLLGMRERVEMLGGSFSVSSTPDKGTTVTAEIPLPSATAQI